MDLVNLRASSTEKLELLRNELRVEFPADDSFYNRICIFACGSLGRLEMAHNSDLDLFFIIRKDSNKHQSSICTHGSEPICSNLDQYLFFSKMYLINRKLGFAEPSKRGYYWNFILQKNLLDIGSREEDFNNSFTARMLFILESKPIYNEIEYDKLLAEIVGKYFTDYENHSSEFYPLYLMNDILRYWYTLTLNYEFGRDDNDTENKKNWKRLKLKYARLITCFSMLACLYKKGITPDYVIGCVKRNPFERLHMLSDEIPDLPETLQLIEEEYNWFMLLRNEGTEWWTQGSNKENAWEHADRFHDLVVHNLMTIVSRNNKELRTKVDIY